jgi:hypothetical protein
VTHDLRATLDHPDRHLQQPLFEVGARLRRDTETFIAEHPWVYDRVVKMARDDRENGWPRGNVNFYWSVLRREAGPKPRDKWGFAFNNDYRAPLARIIEEREPDLADYFTKRPQRSV